MFQSLHIAIRYSYNLLMGLLGDGLDTVVGRSLRLGT